MVGSDAGRRFRAAKDGSGQADQQCDCIRTCIIYSFSLLFLCSLANVCSVVVPGDTATIAGCALVGFGAHCSAYPVPYFTAAASLGLTREVCSTM